MQTYYASFDSTARTLRRSIYQDDALNLEQVPEEMPLEYILGILHYTQNFKTVTKVIFPGDIKGLMHVHEYEQIFAAIPSQIDTLCLGSCALYTKLAAELPYIFSIIPQSVTRLYLGFNRLNLYKAADLAEAFKRLPVHIKHLNIEWNELGHLPTKDLMLILESIPGFIKQLGLGGNQLCEKSGKTLKRLFKTLKDIEHLDLGFNGLGRLNAKALTLAFSGLPTTLLSLNLEANQLVASNTPLLLNAVKALPKSVSFIDLKGNELSKVNPMELAKTLQQRPYFTTYDLTQNMFSNEVLENMRLILNTKPRPKSNKVVFYCSASFLFLCFTGMGGLIGETYFQDDLAVGIGIITGALVGLLTLTALYKMHADCHQNKVSPYAVELDAVQVSDVSNQTFICAGPEMRPKHKTTAIHQFGFLSPLEALREPRDYEYSNEGSISPMALDLN